MHKDMRMTKKITSAQVKLLEKLCNASAVTGDEGEVRRIVLDEVRGYFRSHKVNGEVTVDPLGNVLVTRPGIAAGKRLRVMIAAHMDEIGFMITNDDGKGFYRFENVGGIDVRQLPGKPVLIGKDKIPGVIGAKPIHLTKREELNTIISQETLRIDIGPGGSGVKVGDRAAFATKFFRQGNVLRAKSLDNRLGVSILIELLKGDYPGIDLLAAFTVQEEVGGRGAVAAAFTFDPDLAFALDSTPAYDMPFAEQEDDPQVENIYYNTRLGAGPAIYITDAGTLSDPRLVRFLAETAEANHIPFQFRQPGGGGTDAGAIHRQKTGIPTVSVSVPSRYQHSAASIGRVSDWQNTFALLDAALNRITPDLLNIERD